MQRLRIKFSRGPELKFISHLDIIRLWQRAFNRAGIQLAYSTGFNPHPRISLAAPLPLGVTSEAELMDIVCLKGISPHFFSSTLNQQLPAGMAVLKVQPVGPDLPSLQSIISFTEYVVDVERKHTGEEISMLLADMLAKQSIPWQHQRDTGPHHYDLRLLIDNIWLIDIEESIIRLGMKLRCDSNGSGRPEQVTAALGLTSRPYSVHRTKLIFKTDLGS
jgi:radical SAM-linked protein